MEHPQQGLTAHRSSLPFSHSSGASQFTQLEHLQYESQQSCIYSHSNRTVQGGLSISANDVDDVPNMALRDTGANVTCISYRYAHEVLGFAHARLRSNSLRIITSNGGSGSPVGVIPKGSITFHLKRGTQDQASSTHDVYVMQGVNDLYDVLLGTHDLLLHNAYVVPRRAVLVYCPDMHSQGSWGRTAECPMRIAETPAQGPAHQSAHQRMQYVESSNPPAMAPSSDSLRDAPPLDHDANPQCGLNGRLDCARNYGHRQLSGEADLHSTAVLIAPGQ